MHRSQIMLNEHQHAYLVGEAQRRGVSVSQIIRNLVDEHIAQSRNLENDPFFDIIGMVEGDDPDAAVDHDHYIYGSPRRSEKQTE